MTDKWDGSERRLNQNERLDRIEKDIEIINAKIDKFLEETSKAKGYIGGVTFAVSCMWVLVIAFFQLKGKV